MSKESKVFLQMLHLLVKDTVKFADNMLSGHEISSSDYIGGELSDADIFTLRSILLSKEQRSSLLKLLTAVCNLSMTGALSVIDGVMMSDKLELPDLSLIDRNTGNDIIDEIMLNEEFENLKESDFN